MIPADFVQTALDHIGVPVVHQGVNRNGVDCSGLIISVAADLGVELTRGIINGRWPHGDQVTQAMVNVAYETEDDVPGVIYQVYMKKEPRHLMIGVGDGFVVHAFDGRVAKKLLTERVFCRWKLRCISW